jgi:flagellar biogenesis protein FliO
MKLLLLTLTLISATVLGQEVLPGDAIPALVPEDGDKFVGAFVKVMAAVAVMVGALMFLSWSSRKMINAKIQQVNETSSLKVLEKRNISTKTTLYEIECEGRSVLFAESVNGVTLLQSSHKRETFNIKET